MGYNAVHCAVHSGSTSVVDYFVKAGLDVNAVDIVSQLIVFIGGGNPRAIRL